MVYIFILRLSARNFLGFVVEAASPPILLVMCPSRLAIWPVLFCLFLKDVFTKPWTFEKTFEDSATFLRITLSIFDVFVGRFLMGAPKLSDNSLSLSLSVWSDDIFLLPDLLDDLFSCNRVVNNLNACLVALLWYISCPSFPCDDRGSEVLG